MRKIQACRPKDNLTLLRMRKLQRIRLHEELSALARLLGEWYWQNEEMKEALPYQNPEYRRQRMEREVSRILGNPEHGYGTLQQRLNQDMDNILERLQADLPHLSQQEIFAFSYFVAGFDNALVAHLSALPSATAASALKNKLKDEFLKLRSPNKFEYLELLPAQKLPNW